jgi:hypothetical protein
MKNHISIIKFWRAAELFEPKDITKENAGDASTRFYDIYSEENVPWHQGSTKQFIYQIYCGAIEIQTFIDVFENIFGKNEFDDFSGQQRGKIATFTFKADRLGQPIPGSLTLSSAAWLLGKTLTSGFNSSNWLDGFEKAFYEYAEFFDQRIQLLIDRKSEYKENIQVKNSKNRSISISYDELTNETQLICKRIGLLSVVDIVKVSYKSFEMRSSEATVSNDIDILNSFIQKDLGIVANEVEKGNYGAGLKTYLTNDKEINTTARIDLKTSASTLFEKLSPSLFSSGRWAEKNLFPLAFSQQFAVNTMLKNLAGNQSGMFSVNGPPGTGKTTMLKDVIASIIVDRAKILAKYSDPAQAFKGKNNLWASKSFEHWIAPIDEQLKHSGIVIASSNNGAVENITKEFPIKEKLDETWHEGCEYFSETASDLLGQPAWGMIAAALGNSKNRDSFVQKFWFGENGFLNILKHAEIKTDEPNEKSWDVAAKEFKDALEKEERLRKFKAEIYRQITEKINLETKIKDSKKSKSQIQSELNIIQKQLQSAEFREEQVNSERERLIREKTFHDNARPSLFSIIVSLGKTLKLWKLDDEKIQVGLSKIKDKIFGAEQEIWRIKGKNKELNQKIQRSNDIIEKDIRRLNELARFLEIEYSNHNLQFIPKIEDWNDPSKEKERELSAPWSDDEWNLARVSVFAKALKLQKAFILANAKTIKRNLSALVDVLSGKISANQKMNAASDIWATLFLIVPVVSTTFASFDKLFRTLGREEIGWLLIDEAGQAVPQAAVGAIWRSQRTIVVGDPLQLEPVSIIPDKMEKTLARQFEVSDTWLPGRTSVQKLADRVNKIGTYVKTDSDYKIWVGSPLRVHRRCLNPMFNISNKVAYDELMVYGTPELSKYLYLPPSDWINVQSDYSAGHWIEEEGLALEILLKSLIEKGCRPQDIFLISPFAQVATKLQDFKLKKGIKVAGTIHTTQGKESDVVILVLGGNPEKPRAKVWASSKPNLLNVAVSRAKERIYVIGNRKEWGKMPYFNILDRYLNADSKQNL